MFTQQHYIKIAEVLRRNRTTILYDSSVLFKRLVWDFVELFKENSKFDEKKFLDAIYGKEKGR
jgi:hypothetical protein